MIETLTGEDQRLAGRASRATSTETMVAAVLVFLLPIETLQIASRSANAGTLLAALLAPILLVAAFAVQPARRLIAGLVGSVGLGIVLTELSVGEGRVVDRSYELGLIGYVLAGALTVAAIVWARRLLSNRAVATLFALGALAEALLNQDMWRDNPWKYSFGWPVGILMLALLHRRSTATQVAALGTLGGISAFLGTRSYFALFVITAALIIVGPSLVASIRTGSGARTTRVLVLLAFAGFVVYEGGTYLATTGNLGSETQAETLANLRSGSSVIATGRPEGAATVSLVLSRPIGFGPGVVPSPSELDRAKRALASRGVVTNSDYVTEEMFGGHIELHSIVGDMWVCFGFLGLWTAIYLAFHVVQGLARQLSSPSAFLVFLAVTTLWSLAFSPLPAALVPAVLAFSLLLPNRGSPSGTRAEDSDPFIDFMSLDTQSVAYSGRAWAPTRKR